MAEEQRNPINPLSNIIPKEGNDENCYTFTFSGGMEEKVHKIPSPGAWLRAGPGPGISFEEWVASVRRHREKYHFSGVPRRPQRAEGMPLENLPLPQQQLSAGVPALQLDRNSVSPQSCDQTSELSLRDRLGNAYMMDVESNNFSWNALSSLYHTKHTSKANSEDEMNKALEVTVNSGGFVFYALFNTVKNDDVSPREGAAVIKITSSRMATQSERLGYELAKWLGVQTPHARVIHNSSLEWQQIKNAAERARDLAVSAGNEVGEMTCFDLLEALESSRCLFLMNYVHGSPLLDNSNAFDSREAAGNTAAALGRVLMLDLILRNEDRLPCRELGWRGNCANLLYADKASSTYMNALERVYDSTIRSYKPHFIRSLEKERRSISVKGRYSFQDSIESDELLCVRSTMKHSYIDEIKHTDFHIVAIDSGVPRRPPAGKRVKDQNNYPKLVELIVNSQVYSSNLLHDISGGKLGFAAVDEVVEPIDTCCLSEADMISVIHEFQKGFRGALRDLQGFHIFLLTLYQKLDGLLRIFLLIISKTSGEEDVGCSDSPSNYVSFNLSSSFISEIRGDSCETEPLKTTSLSCAGSRENYDLTSPRSRDNWNGKYAKGSAELSRSLRLTMKLRDFHRFAKVDAEMNKELEQWNEMLRIEVVKLCQDNNFNSGFFEGSDNNIVIDAYELKVRLEHILERISLISDAGSIERPSPITDYLYIGGALAARSRHTLQYLGITHVLCLCSNEIGQSDSQYPDLFEYRNFSVSDDDDADISDLFEETSDFIDYVEYLGGKILVHCFEGKSRSATVVLAYLMLRKELSLAEAWNKLKKVHRRAQPNDGFAKTLLDLDKKLHGKVSMEWQHRRRAMKVCPICGKNAGLSSSSLKLHLQKFHKKLSSGSVDSAMKLEIEKTLEALRTSRGGSVSPTKKQSQSFDDPFGQ